MKPAKPGATEEKHKEWLRDRLREALAAAAAARGRDPAVFVVAWLCAEADLPDTERLYPVGAGESS